MENNVGFTSSLIRSVDSFPSSCTPSVEGILDLLDTIEVTSPEKDKTGDMGDFKGFKIMLDENKNFEKSR